MQIALVSLHDSKRVSHWSGTPHYLVRALRDRGHSVLEVCPATTPTAVAMGGVCRLLRAIRGPSCDATRQLLVARSQSRKAQRMLSGLVYDLVLSPASSTVSAGLAASGPLVTWEDATFAAMSGYYDGGWRRQSRATIEAGHRLQRESLAAASLAVFSSEWAAKSAIDCYGTNPEKVCVIPFGANLRESPAISLVEAALQARLRSSECRLLFVGVEWGRKGGETVLRTAEILHRSGVKVAVDVVGVRPPCAVPDYVRVHGYVSKASESGRDFLDSLFFAAHYLFVPSVAECYGLIYAEASAFGVPSLSRRTGGVSSVVVDGENGWLLPLEAPPEAYADLIRGGRANPEGYAVMSRRARVLFEERFNWNAAIAALEREISSRFFSGSRD